MIFKSVDLKATLKGENEGKHLNKGVFQCACSSGVVRLLTYKGAVVLDPYAGSGTTGLACLRLGREAIMIEKESEYCSIIRERLNNIQPKLFE